MNTHELALKTVTAEPLNAETPHGILHRDRTPTDLFFKRNHFSMPTFTDEEWHLNIILGESRVSYSLDEIKDLPKKTLLVTMECAGNGRKGMDPAPAGTAWDVGAVSQGEFTGTSLGNLIRISDLPENTIELRFVGADRGITREGQEAAYERSLPLDTAFHADTLLVWEMNGVPLPPEHGHPLRLLLPGWYGMASVKWLMEIHAHTEPFTGFFQVKDYVFEDHVGPEKIANGTPLGAKLVRSFILEPEDSQTVQAGDQKIAGVAWAGDTLIEKVELSFDGGLSWVSSELSKQISAYSMCRWSYLWDPPASGEYRIMARATDSNGVFQPLGAVWNKGGYANNQVQSITVMVS